MFCWCELGIFNQITGVPPSGRSTKFQSQEFLLAAVRQKLITGRFPLSGPLKFPFEVFWVLQTKLAGGLVALTSWLVPEPKGGATSTRVLPLFRGISTRYVTNVDFGLHSGSSPFVSMFTGNLHRFKLQTSPSHEPRLPMGLMLASRTILIRCGSRFRKEFIIFVGVSD